MKIAVIGATGKAGQKIVEEALQRGHEVTAIVRSAAKVTASIPVIEKEVFELTQEDVKGFDVVVNAFGAPAGQEELHVKAGRHLITIFNGIDTKLFVVGGAGSLFVDPEKKVRVMDTPDFPEMFLATAQNQGQNLVDLQQSSIHWTFLSPSAFFDPEGPRTGHYTAGIDHLLVNDAGNSYVSYADYAVAVLDELEQPQHENSRFTVTSNK
ncbi:NAD(P)-dependent oxidoreductase [Lysinibacillus irui]|uniref:NAD(P)-dependent oxidoreductase n=2 Tax=Lysinibacillus TaxID=400634 RepID=A0ABU5NSG1_9BACI|nr:NAD(P)-dependent oxidoreductase [Lysinibacillus irui]MEA0553287.1 NAD(P)-dependent oxidoreductase [Lysinibacillus irui]MEA0978953.1 NAD(P)-dependent oxidoreductase [Lysinibacillus irui]MEA1045107.1 NAD(P)-dependent oxidoreductase [Lysinibacillus irui]